MCQMLFIVYTQKYKHHAVLLLLVGCVIYQTDSLTDSNYKLWIINKKKHNWKELESEQEQEDSGKELTLGKKRRKILFFDFFPFGKEETALGVAYFYSFWT